jgi:hypothetical protein
MNILSLKNNIKKKMYIGSCMWANEYTLSSLDLGLLVLFTFFNIQRFFTWKDWDYFSCEKALNIKTYK